MLMYWYPWAARPLDIIASADAFTFASSTSTPQASHEFHPIGGVSASLSCRETMVSPRLGEPYGPATFSVSSVAPGRASAPRMIPVVEWRVRPAGRPRAEKTRGPSPVAGTRKRKGRPGVAPVARGPWIAGKALGAAIEIVAGGSGG